jgi:hypothetical protein
MGYDCTLHLVDEESIRRRLVPRLLGMLNTAPEPEPDPEPERLPTIWQRWGFTVPAPSRLVPQTAQQTTFDRQHPNAAAHWRRTRRIVKWCHPAEAASAICELAILYTSAELSWLPSRNLALSMWHRCKPNGAPEYPLELIASPEILFGDLVAAYPGMAGQFPTGGFDGNGSLGIFIPSANVGEMLTWLHGVLDPLDPGDRRPYANLLRVLTAAHARGHAYWEATEFEVTMPVEGFLSAPAVSGAAGIRKHQLLEEWDHSQGRPMCSGPFDGRLVFTGGGHTYAFDAREWPPAKHWRVTASSHYPARSSDGSWLLMMHTQRDVIEFGMLRPESDRFVWQSLEIDADPPIRQFPIAGFLGSRAAILDVRSHGQPYRLLLQDGNRLVPGPALPPVGPCGRPLRGSPKPRVGFATLATGEPLLMWDGDLYQVAADRMTKRFTLSAPDSLGSENVMMTMPSGSLFFLSWRRLYELRPDGTVVAHAHGIVNIRTIAQGPSGTLLLWQGDNPQDDIGKLYDPATQLAASLTRDTFGFSEDYEHLDSVFWSHRTDLVIVQFQGLCHAVPAKVVLDLPRRPPEAFAPRRLEGYRLTTEPASGFHDRVAGLSPCYVHDAETRVDILLQQNNHPRPTRPFRLALALQADGAVADVRVIRPLSDPLAEQFADEIRTAQPSFFYPPPTGDLQLEIEIEPVTPKGR